MDKGGLFRLYLEAQIDGARLYRYYVKEKTRLYVEEKPFSA